MGEHDILELVKQKIGNIRPRLLDLSRNNPLIATKLSPRSSAQIRVVDELPEVLFYKLNNGQTMRIIPLPDIEEDPKDEEGKAFRDALANARLTDDPYLKEMDGIERDAEDYLDRVRSVERALKDRIRVELGLPPREKKAEINLAQHAKNNGITPSYDLPKREEGAQSGKHADDDIQTLLLPKDLERKLNSIISKCRTWTQETGINVLHIAYGFLEWSEPNQTQTSFAPLILSTAQLEKRRSQKGPEYWVSGAGEEPEYNAVLAEKLKIDFGIELPPLDGASIEDYFELIARITPKHITWRVRRQIAIGVFPSARMAMYRDLDPEDPLMRATDTVRSLLAGTGIQSATPFAEEYHVDAPEFERCVPCIVMDADSSQVSTLVDIANGKNVAVEGPPGTGKSQTIVNAIAAALFAGQRVLFVAEKLAALNVVKSRLEAIGLGEFLLPLQAERSTREQVISSVRDRVEMQAPAPMRDYDAQVGEYRRTREDLAGYVDILKQEFSGTGLTVFEILSRTIATAEALADLPANVLERCAISDGFLSEQGLLRLADMTRSVERVHAGAGTSSDAWKSTELLHPDRFTVEAACRLAGGAAEAFATLARSRSNLAAYGIEKASAIPALQNIEKHLRECIALPRHIQPVLRNLLDGDTAARALAFIESCDACAEQARLLEADGIVEIGTEGLARIETIAKICESAKLDSLDLDALSAALEDKRQLLARACAVESAARPFVEAHADSDRWRFTDIALARRAVENAGRETLLHRNPALADPAGVTSLKRLCAQIRWLQVHRADLAKRAVMSVAASPELLTESAATLRSAGWLQTFSASYRSAKRLVRSLSRSRKLDRNGAVELLEELATYRRNERTFLGNVQAPILFGAYFHDIDTDTAPFERLIGFYEHVNSTFGMLENRDLRNFLHLSETDELELLPAAGVQHQFDNYSSLQSILAREQSAIDALEEARSALIPNLRVLENPRAVNVYALPPLAQSVRDHLSTRASLDGAKSLAAVLDSQFRGWRTGGGALVEACDWASGALEYADALRTLLQADSCESALAAVSTVLNADQSAQQQIGELCAIAKIPAEHFLAVGNDELTASALARAAQDPDGLFNHSAMATVLAELGETGLLPLVMYRSEADGTLSRLREQAAALAVRTLAKQVFKTHGKELARYSGQKLDELRAALADKDRAIIELSRRQLRHKVYSTARPPSGNGMGRKSSWTQMALIENEIGKQQRFISVRDLTERAGEALATLKPCWMMSPLAVAQYVKKGALQFDLCIIDEASQMPPEAAVGALLRSKQAVVVGDTNQLPPSNFFKKLIDDDQIDDDETVLEESILEMANSTFRPPRRLRWHYRSRHSGLIKFSNRLIYGDDLIVFPSANESMPNMGVEHRYAEGLYKSGTNAIEARVMVDAILEFMRRDPRRSLGVVTLNQKQRDLISEEFEQALPRDLAAQAYVDDWRSKNEGLEEFFIKNLENVQGDERDVMFIGTVYGPAAKGTRVMQRFGPINGLAGRRRLNVLFSRAKEKIVTFSSMTAADIVADESGNAGAYMLKRWLEYSASGILEGGTTTQREPDSDFEIFVINQIKAMGFEAVPQVGAAGYFIDIGVRHPNWPYGYLLGVECDGASYHSAKSARDRDRLREKVLTDLGWRLHRIWSTDWFNNPRREAERLRIVIADRMIELKAKEADFIHSADNLVRQSCSSLNEDTTVPVASAADQPRNDRKSSRPSASGRCVEVGDTVRVRYVNDSSKTIQVTISDAKSDPGAGIVYYETPIAKALLGAEEGDEVEVLVGSYVHLATIESIQKRE